MSFFEFNTLTDRNVFVGKLFNKGIKCKYSYEVGNKFHVYTENNINIDDFKD